MYDPGTPADAAADTSASIEHSGLAASSKRWMSLHEGRNPSAESDDSDTDADDAGANGLLGGAHRFDFSDPLDVHDGRTDAQENALSEDVLLRHAQHSFAHIAGPAMLLPDARSMLLFSVVACEGLPSTDAMKTAPEDEAYFAVVQYGDIYMRTSGVRGTAEPRFERYPSHDFLWRFRASDGTPPKVTVVLCRWRKDAPAEYVGECAMTLDAPARLNRPQMRWMKLAEGAGGAAGAHGPGKIPAGARALLRMALVEPSGFDDAAYRHARSAESAAAAAAEKGSLARRMVKEKPYVAFSLFAARALPRSRTKLHRSWIQAQLMRGPEEDAAETDNRARGRPTDGDREREALRDRAVSSVAVLERWGAGSGPNASAARRISNVRRAEPCWAATWGPRPADAPPASAAAGARGERSKKDFHFRLPQRPGSALPPAQDSQNGLTVRVFEYARDLRALDGAPAGRRIVARTRLAPPASSAHSADPFERNCLRSQWLKLAPAGGGREGESAGASGSAGELLAVWGLCCPAELAYALFPPQRLKFRTQAPAPGAASAAASISLPQSPPGAGSDGLTRARGDGTRAAAAAKEAAAAAAAEEAAAAAAAAVATPEQLQRWGARLQRELLEPLRAVLATADADVAEARPGDFAAAADAKDSVRNDALSVQVERSLETLTKLLRMQTSLRERFDEKRRAQQKRLDAVRAAASGGSSGVGSDWEELLVTMRAKAKFLREKLVAKVRIVEEAAAGTTGGDVVPTDGAKLEGMSASELAAHFVAVDARIKRSIIEQSSRLHASYEADGGTFVAALEKLKATTEASERAVLG
jgi:hypothetical protein